MVSRIPGDAGSAVRRVRRASRVGRERPAVRGVERPRAENEQPLETGPGLRQVDASPRQPGPPREREAARCRRRRRTLARLEQHRHRPRRVPRRVDNAAGDAHGSSDTAVADLDVYRLPPAAGRPREEGLSRFQVTGRASRSRAAR